MIKRDQSYVRRSLYYDYRKNIRFIYEKHSELHVIQKFKNKKLAMSHSLKRKKLIKKCNINFIFITILILIIVSTDPSGYKCILVYLISYPDSVQYSKEIIFENERLTLLKPDDLMRLFNVKIFRLENLT